MKVYELLNEPNKWIKQEFAKDINGNSVFLTNPKAISWCLLGAICKCYQLNYENIKCKVKSELRCDSITKWNDTHTYEEVIELCKKLDI